PAPVPCQPRGAQGPVMGTYRSGGRRPMRISDTSDLWWKTGVIYCLDVQTFMDWNDDGMGDFTGLAERLDYLAELGVTCLWLMPLPPTADRQQRRTHPHYYWTGPATR